jgi:hypothetical protein
MKISKLNSRGIAHLLAPLMIVLFLAIGGTFMLIRSHADSNPYSCGNPKPTLSIGSSGTCVRFLQWQLTDVYHISTYGIDGSFGSKTRAAVVYFQGHHGLTTDGVVGPETWSKVGGVTAGANEKVENVTYEKTAPATSSSSEPVVPMDELFYVTWDATSPGVTHANGTRGCPGTGQSWCSNYLSGSSAAVWNGPASYSAIDRTNGKLLRFSDARVAINAFWLSSKGGNVTNYSGLSYLLTISNGGRTIYQSRIYGVNSGAHYDFPYASSIDRLSVRISNVQDSSNNGDNLAVYAVNLL